MPKLTCVKCSVDLKPEENGVKVVELMRNDTEIYKIWDTDLWKCPICGIEIIGGYAQEPFFEHYKGNGQELLNKFKANNERIVFCKEYLHTPLPRF